MPQKNLVICPVYNEQDTIREFYHKLRDFYIQDVVFIDDGSNDGSKDFLLDIKSKETFLIGHTERQGYGAALLSGFRFSVEGCYRKIITIDVDLQHDPENIPLFLNELLRHEVVLGSRYTGTETHLNEPNVPGARLTINRYVSKLLGQLFSAHFTDPFCGFRGYRDAFLKRAMLNHKSYGLGLEIILEIIRTKTPFKEIPIKVVYNNKLRRFLDGLEDPRTRLLYYLDIISEKKMGIFQNNRTLKGSPLCLSSTQL